MELTQLLYFKIIAECETITQAAEKLHVSQPALSTMLRKLEDELGLRLFERKRNRIALNAAGKLALTHANAILERVEQMKIELYKFEKHENIYSIAFCDPGPQWFFIPKFSATHPHIQIKSTLFEKNNDTANLLFNHTNDIVVSSNKSEHPEIISVPFIKDQLLLSVPENSPLAQIKELNLKTDCPEELQSLALFYVGGDFFETKQKPFWQEFCPQVQLTLYDDFFMFSQLVRGTNTLTISTQLAKHYRDDGKGRILIPLTDDELTIQYHLSYLKTNEERLKPFIIWAKQCASDFSFK